MDGGERKGSDGAEGEGRGERHDMEMTAETMRSFKDLVYERCHLTFPQSREVQLRRWVMQRASVGRFRSLADYFLTLRSDTKEFDRLVSLITTRETYFFRMPEQFEVLREAVLPAIADRESRRSMSALARGEKHRMKVDVWSAGCATGQETYSLAMQVLDALRYPKAWDITVLGTDINADALEIARSGRYETLRLGKTPSRLIERHFMPVAPGEIVLSEEVREITQFEVLNLRELPQRDQYRNRFDIIFCRNVMIYFDLPAQQRLITALTACLKPGGHLFTGEGEVLHLYTHALESVEHGDAVYYRRPEEA